MHKLEDLGSKTWARCAATVDSFEFVSFLVYDPGPVSVQKNDTPVIANFNQDHIALFALATFLLAAGFFVLILSLRQSSRDLRHRSFWQLVRELDVLTISLILLFISGIIFLAGVLRIPPDQTLMQTLTAGFVSSLLQDIVFFSFVGLILLAFNRLTFYKTLSEEDRIRFLFDAKNLKADELNQIKHGLPELACEYVEATTFIDVKITSKKKKFVLLDVTRQFIVGNYFHDRDAHYRLSLNLTPSEAPKKQIQLGEPVLTVFSTVSTIAKADEFGNFPKLGDDVTLHPLQSLPHQASGFRWSSPVLPIGPSERRITTKRFEGWQTVPIAEDDEDCAYDIFLTRAYQTSSLTLRNSLKSNIEFRVRHNDMEYIGSLEAGEERAPLRLTNCAAGDEISIQIIPV